jgi:hypothetical protein
MQVTPEQAKEMLILIKKLCAALGPAQTLTVANKRLSVEARRVEVGQQRR